MKSHPLLTKLWLMTDKNHYNLGKSLKFRQSKGNNSSITYDTLIRLDMHSRTMLAILCSHIFSIILKKFPSFVT